MLIGVCEIEFFIPASGSLKEKRFVLESIKKRVRQKFNVSIAEVGDTEKWQHGFLGLAIVSNANKFIDKVFSQVINLIENDSRLEVLKCETDVY